MWRVSRWFGVGMMRCGRQIDVVDGSTQDRHVITWVGSSGGFWRSPSFPFNAESHPRRNSYTHPMMQSHVDKSWEGG